MLTLLAIVGFIALLILGVVVVVASCWVDPRVMARLELREQQRAAEAQIQRRVQVTVQQMFDAARRNS